MDPPLDWDAAALAVGGDEPDEAFLCELLACFVREGLPHVRTAFDAASRLAARDIRVTAFANRVQEAGAGVVSLSSLYADPLGALRRSQHRLPEACD